MPEFSTLPPLSLYIHIPWCVRKCPYCDFNSHNAPQALPQAEYVDALLRDLDVDRDLAQGRSIRTIFFGGGTPSLFSAESIARILDGVAARVPIDDGAEITLETNPGTIEHDSFRGYARAGVNRISLGVQSFNDDALRRIGRIHDADQAERAVGQAQEAGLGNLNIDLMYALPQQTLEGALADVDRALLLQPTHLSHYQLTLEPNTQFAANPPPLPDEDSAWDMQEACQARIAQSGFAQYEVSAYSTRGKMSRHNLNYWTFGDYLGIGAGAHAKITQRDDSTIRRRWKLRAPRGYLEHAGTPRGVGGDDVVAQAHVPFEFMLNGLRLNAGFSFAQFFAHTGLGMDAIQGKLDAAIERGWLEGIDDTIRATPFGQRFLNDVIAFFLPDKESSR